MGVLKDHHLEANIFVFGILKPNALDILYLPRDILEKHSWVETLGLSYRILCCFRRREGCTWTCNHDMAIFRTNGIYEMIITTIIMVIMTDQLDTERILILACTLHSP